MNNKNIIDSFNYAVSGIIIAAKIDKNFRIHYIIGFIVIAFSLFLDFSRIEFMILLFAVTLVLVSEMINTAIEKSIDLYTKDYHPLAKLVKDVAAGAVLISSMNAIVVGYLLFFDRLNPITKLVIFKIRSSEVHLTFVALILVIFLTIMLKAKYFKGKGTHFQGGIVSGHAAISFCIATIISFISEHILITTLSYGLALLVAESRIEGKIHSFIEVVYGSLLGLLVGIIIFQLVG